MNPEKMLLYYSFSQIKGISAKKEKEYWEANETLASLSEGLNAQQTLFGESTQKDDISQSLFALQNGDASFFQDRLDHKYYYRIAYSFPKQTMFLDIETTGLSTNYHYITYVGWLLDGTYGYWVQGTDPEPFLNAFRSAKIIVTFNGTMFDCKFLDHQFATNEFSKKANLDLMYLCRRFGLTGGQKEIEHHVGFTRPKSLTEVDGKEAIALWYSFLFGKRSALKRLIQYNFYDVVGMAYILDCVFFEQVYGYEFPRLGSPELFFPKSLSLNDSTPLPSPAVCENIREYVKEHISNFSNEFLIRSLPYRIVGIDLAGKTTSRTGLCFLQGNSAKTKVAHTDEDILEFVEEMQPDLISIDAPLSLPKGRNSVYDDDPSRDSAGIMRYCERELKRRNINSYPALIRSMQELTRRGIHLAGEFRKNGYPVIECFPGAAQDVVQLPRKRTDETLLKKGLSRFGIQGPFCKEPVCHDELDAITASLVGQFFISGYYEPIGIPEENDMIIPQKQYRAASHRCVIGIAGHVAAGKTTLGNYLASRGFHYIRYSQIIQQALSSSGYTAERDDLRATGAALFSANHQYDLNQRLASSLGSYPNVVIDGMRHLEDYTFWKEQCFLNFILIYIDADYELREKRFSARQDESISYESAVSHPAEKDVPFLKNKADFIIANNGSIEDLNTTVLKILST